MANATGSCNGAQLQRIGANSQSQLGEPIVAMWKAWGQARARFPCGAAMNGG
jgi:hypothetical protein